MTQNQSGKQLFEWVKASEIPLPDPKINETVNILYRGRANMITGIADNWYWEAGADTRNYPVHNDSWSAIEYLVPAQTSTGKQLPTDEEIEAYAERASSEYLDEVVEYSIKREIVKACQWILAQGESDKWIRVEDGLPEAEGEYLCGTEIKTPVSHSFHKNIYNFGFYTVRGSDHPIVDADGFTGCFTDKLGYGAMVTHWQPLPNAPTNK